LPSRADFFEKREKARRAWGSAGFVLLGKNPIAYQ
jgi:hypothetical protein